MTPQRWAALGCILAAVGVGAGAFGVHGLAPILTPDRLENWETAARYHLIHAVAIIAVAVGLAGKPGRLATSAPALLAVGVLVFSGTLYLLALTGQRWLGAVTPIGGAAFVAGWIAAGVAFARR